MFERGNFSSDVVETINGVRLLHDLRAVPVVVVKMDIEGSEFAVLTQMMVHGSLCHAVSHLTVEFHGRFGPIPMYAKNSDEAVGYERWLSSALLKGSTHCKLKTVTSLDDETYVNDIPGETERIIREYGGGRMAGL